MKKKLKSGYDQGVQCSTMHSSLPTQGQRIRPSNSHLREEREREGGRGERGRRGGRKEGRGGGRRGEGRDTICEIEPPISSNLADAKWTASLNDKGNLFR